MGTKLPTSILAVFAAAPSAFETMLHLRDTNPVKRVIAIEIPQVTAFFNRFTRLSRDMFGKTLPVMPSAAAAPKIGINQLSANFTISSEAPSIIT